MSSDRLVEVSRLCKSYGSTRAVDSVSFTVERGQVVVLLGPNASGKTTILRSVAGLLHPDSGSVRICGLDPHKDYRQARRAFSYVPQQAAFPTQLTAAEVVAFHARLCRAPSERAAAALQEAGISELEARKAVGELSGGMRQRLSLALAALPEVQVLLLDEPTANLDPDAVLRTRRLARRWRSQGRALLLSTHVLADVEELADEVVVLVGGRAVARKGIAELRSELGRRALLRVELDSPAEAHRQIALQCGAVEARLNGRSLVVTAAADRRFAILEGLRSLGEIRNIQTEEPSLEQVYLSYVESKEAG